MSEYNPDRKNSAKYSETLISAVGQLQMFWRTLRNTLTTPKRTATNSRQLEPWPVSQIAVPFHDDDDKRTMVAPTGWSTPTEHSYPAVEEEVGEAYRAVIAETPVGASRGGLPFPAGPLDPGALESALATEVGLAVVTPEPAKGPLVSPELYQHVPELNPETQKPPFKFELNADKLRDGLPAETLAAMDEGQKAIDAFVRSVAVATDGMSDEQAQAYLDAALERQFGKSDLEPPLG